MTEKERMLSGKLYFPGELSLSQGRAQASRLTHQINTEPEPDALLPLFQSLLGAFGEDSWINPPFHCDYGKNIHIGKHFFANYDCIFLDCSSITIGDDVFLAPRVSIFTATHPIDAGVRNSELEYGKPVTIGSSVWIGGNTVINPGVTIGDNVVIGSGSVVTRDIPSGVIAAGNPCRVLRPITGEDRRYWEAQAAEYYRDRQG